MVDTVRLTKRAKWVRKVARHSASVDSKLVLAMVIEPLLQLLRHMEESRGQRWVTLREAIRATARGKNYFEKPLSSLGGQNRLQAWEKLGLADRTEDGWWLISPVAVAEARHKDDSAPKPESEGKKAADIAARFAA